MTMGMMNRNFVLGMGRQLTPEWHRVVEPELEVLYAFFGHDPFGFHTK
jgi:hypothetical protein